MAQKLMRHSDPKLTYTHVMLGTKAEAIDMLLEIAATAAKSQESAKAETDDLPADAIGKVRTSEWAGTRAALNNK